MNTLSLYAPGGRLIGRLSYNSDFSGDVEIRTRKKELAFDISSDRQTVAVSGSVLLALYEAMKRAELEEVL